MLVRRPTSPSSALDKKIADNPPDRYVPLPGSRFGLVSNEYDKNFYAQCSYIAARTLIRCKQVRSKEALARNDGICEMHDKLCSTLKELSNKEKVRLESDFVTKRRRIPMVIRTNDYVCEEDPSLYSVSTCYGSIPNYIAFEDQMLYQLRNANTFTDKELLKMQLEMTKREIATLEEVRSIAKEDARRFYQMFDYSNKTKRKYINLDKLQGKAFEANEMYSKSHKEMEELFVKPQVKKPACTNRCIQGTECKTDGEMVFVLLQEVVGRVADDGIMAEDDPDRCRSSAVPSSSYCFNHILLDKLQKVYVPCDRCQMPCINLGHEVALCTTHLSVLNNVRRVNLMEAKNVPNSPVFINKVVIDEEERNPHAADQAARLLQKVHENPTAQMTAAAQARSRMQLQQAASQPRQTLSSTFPHNQQQQQQQQQMPPTAMSPAINIHNVPILPRQNSRAKRMANDEASMRCARARPFNRDNFGDKPINTVQPGSSFSSTVQKSSILNATMPIRPPAVYRNVHKPPPASATSNIQTTSVGGQRVLQRPTHVALPQSDTQQKARHDLIAQSAAALTAQKFKQQQQTAPQAQAGSQDDMEFLEEDRKTPPPDDIGMVRQYGRRPSTAGRGQKARGIHSGSAASGSGTTTAGKGRGMPMVHTLQPPGRTIRYMTSKPLGNLTVPVLSSQPQSTAAAGKLSGIPPSEVPPSFPPAKPLGMGSLNAPLNPPPDFAAPFDLEEFRRLADGMSDVPLGDVMSYVIKQQVNPKNLTPNELAQLVNQAIANDPNKHAAGSSNARSGSAVSKQASSHATSSATASIELPEISLSRERPQPPHRLLATTPRIIPLERVPPSASESPAKVVRTPQPPANEQTEKATKRDSKSASKETDRANRSSSSRPGSSMSAEEEEMANERRASLRTRPAQQNPPPMRNATKRAASDKDKGGQAKRARKEADTQLTVADTEQMDPLSILAEAAQRVDKRGEDGLVKISPAKAFKSPDKEEFEEEL